MVAFYFPYMFLYLLRMVKIGAVNAVNDGGECPRSVSSLDLFLCPLLLLYRSPRTLCELPSLNQTDPRIIKKK